MEEDRRHKTINLTGPALLIGIGVILLLRNLGYLQWSMWNLVRLWPILIISAGLEILLGRRSLLGSLIAAGLVLILVVGGVWLLQAPTGSGETIEISESRNDITAARVTLAPAVAQLRVGALNDSPNFVEGTVHEVRGENVEQRFSDDTGDGTGRLTLETETAHSSWIGGAEPRTWALDFHPDVSLDLEADLGVGEAELDLAELSIDDLAVSFGVGRLEIWLPATGRFDVEIDGGIGSIVVHVPEGMVARVRAETAIVGRDLPRHYHHEDNTYTAPGYADADHHADITINLAIGSVAVKAED